MKEKRGLVSIGHPGNMALHLSEHVNSLSTSHVSTLLLSPLMATGTLQQSAICANAWWCPGEHGLSLTDLFAATGYRYSSATLASERATPILIAQKSRIRPDSYVRPPSPTPDPAITGHHPSRLSPVTSSRFYVLRFTFYRDQSIIEKDWKLGITTELNRDAHQIFSTDHNCTTDFRRCFILLSK